ncbi:MAG: ribbon-helix-helix protein, CopG family [Armatimonadota bacterium]
MPYVRTQIQLEPEQYRKLREEAFRRNMSMSALLREFVAQKIGPPRQRRVDMERAMAFVGMGHDTATDVSVRHDDYLAGLAE